MSATDAQRHIQYLREALWNGRECGRAAVMVGAGFSRNAKSIQASAEPFPSWHELSSELVNRLYPTESRERERALRRARDPRGFLRLAQEVEAEFGRSELHNLLISTIPDQEYRPGALHEVLLRLPWADVLTTNYDTLLERAAAVLATSHYDVVKTVDDIPGTLRPRIVKLHGSFPSARPFICTEEDFRTYRQRFAPFVNLAQQTLMESVLCLIGFSGDDPNFLYWSGWVRDNLGESAPTIYLCGALDLTGPEEKLLSKRNVVPVDLSPLLDDTNVVAEHRNAKATEWLLAALAAGEPESPLLWPEQAAPEHEPVSADVPDELKPASSRLRQEPLWPKRQKN